MGVPTTEDGLVQAIRRRVRRDHPSAWQFKVVGSPYQVAGIPDMLFCIEGLLVGMEAKFVRPGESVQAARERATPQQRNQIELINKSGGIAGVVTSVEEALDLIRRGFVKQTRTIERRKNEDATQRNGA